jgi:hypothetical protein
MTDRIAEIAARCEAATQGPWETNWLDDCFIEPRICMIPANGCYDYDKFGANSEFIAHAREDIPYLLSQLAEREKEIERLREAQRWIPMTERLPEAEHIVIAWVKSKTTPTYQFATQLAHVGHHEKTTEDWRDYEGDTEYDEENDCFWIKECWYEVNIVDDNPNWQVDDDYIVTHWMELPTPPEEGDSQE